MIYDFAKIEAVIGTEAASKLTAWLAGGGTLYLVDDSDNDVATIELVLQQKAVGITDSVVLVKAVRECAALLDPSADWSEAKNAHAKCLTKIGWVKHPVAVRWSDGLFRVWTKYPMTNAQIRERLDESKKWN